MKKFLTILFATATVLVSGQLRVDAQSASLKTNLIYDATTSISLGAELKLSPSFSLEIPVSYNPWTFNDNSKIKHLLLQPELRYWPCTPFSGHFFGLHGHYAIYNIGGVWPVRNNRYEGWLAGAGLGYGYHFALTDHLGAELEIGAGYAYLDYDKFPCERCGEKIGSGTRNYWGPTRLSASLVYSFGKPSPKRRGCSVCGKKSAVMPVYVEPDATAPQVALPAAAQVRTDTVYVQVEKTDTVIVRSLVRDAYLDYALDRAEIDPHLGGNARELAKIREMFSVDSEDIAGVIIDGFTSPEGSSDHNLQLSSARAESMKSYISNEYGIPAEMISTFGNGEDWTGLAQLARERGLAYAGQIAEIAADASSDDAKDAELRQLEGGSVYRYLTDNIFPLLRRVRVELLLKK